MPGPALHLGATVLCSHAGQALPAAPFGRVTVSGQPVVTLASPYAVTGCSLAGTASPPCTTGQFLTGAARVTAGGAPLALLTGTSVCIPTGTPMLPAAAQARVVAT